VWLGSRRGANQGGNLPASLADRETAGGEKPRLVVRKPRRGAVFFRSSDAPVDYSYMLEVVNLTFTETRRPPFPPPYLAGESVVSVLVAAAEKRADRDSAFSFTHVLLTSLALLLFPFSDSP